jgi:hypothetical protein
LFRKARTFVLAAVIVAVPFLAASGASAATLVGSSCVGTRAESEFVTLVPLTNASNPGALAIPSTGVLTSWSVSVVPYPGGISEKVKVFRPTGIPNTFTAVGESTLQPIEGGTNTFETRIPVQVGDRLGVTSNFEGIWCGEAEEGEEESPNVFGAYPSDVALGTSATFTGVPHGQVAVSGTVETDADGDGYGDETQDKCPTDASTQGACPTPPPPPAPRVTPPPIGLSASAAAKKGLVTVTLTSTAQATVSVGGSVNLGKGKTAKLGGGSQIVAPGTLAKFTILFPGKLKQALKLLPPSKKLTLSLTASAPGATSTSLTVKVPGQLQAQPRHHGQ